MSAARRHVVVGTAGHIDHGKTSLVKALTGTDTDRLPEEKARGITIDLGFAFLEEPDGLTIEVVDVPGHERFVKNMLAGVGGIDLAMLVIAADEGVMPQTREHLAICSLLHIRTGLVVLTKTDTVESDWIELVRDDVATLVRGTFLEGAPVVPVSAKTGAGLDELRATLRRLAETVPARGTDQLPRLPIDRVFTIKGFGTVVTGTLAAGALGVDDRVEVFPRGLVAKVRGLQAHGHAVERAVAGQRTAINLQGLERAAVERGDVIGHAGTLSAVMLVDVVLEMLADAPRALKNRDRVRLHAGTSEIMARALLLEGTELAPGGRGFARLRLEAPLVALAGDRFVIRSYSPIVTIGGGTLLDTDPPRLKRPARLAHLKILEAGAPEAVEAEGVVRVDRDKVRLASHELRLSPVQKTAVDRLEQAFREAAAAPPSPEEALGRAGLSGDEQHELFQLLLESRRLVRVKESLFFHAAALEAIQDKLVTLLRERREIGPGDIKDLLGISRKYAIPLLEYFDARRVTARVGERRVLRGG